MTGTAVGSAVAELNLPGLKPGQQPMDLIPDYQAGIFTRTTHLSDIRGRIDVIPVEERSSVMTSCLGCVFLCLSAWNFFFCHQIQVVLHAFYVDRGWTVVWMNGRADERRVA